jgi:hypothetical protein
MPRLAASKGRQALSGRGANLLDRTCRGGRGGGLPQVVRSLVCAIGGPAVVKRVLPVGIGRPEALL